MAGIVQSIKSLFTKGGSAGVLVPMLAVWNASFQTVFVNGTAVPAGGGTVLTNASKVTVAGENKKKIVQATVGGPAVVLAKPLRPGQPAPWGALMAAYDYTRTGPNASPMPAMVFAGFHMAAQDQAPVYQPGPRSSMYGKDVRVVAQQTGYWLPQGFMATACGASTSPDVFQNGAVAPELQSGVKPAGVTTVGSPLDYAYPPMPCATPTAEALVGYPLARTMGQLQLAQAQGDAAPLWLKTAGVPGATPVYSNAVASAMARGCQASTVSSASALQLPPGTTVTAPPRAGVSLRESDALTALAVASTGASSLYDTLGFVSELPWRAVPTQVPTQSHLNANLVPVSDAAECRKKDILRYNGMLDRLVDLRLQQVRLAPV
jgi:hypothetical protein